MIVRCPAKLNLSFEILGKREDGYHEIRSVMQTIEVCDYLIIEKSEKGMFTGAILCPVKELLVTKAATVLEEAIGRSLPCRVHLDKSIPVGAGLGGGSSDAAGMLLALNELYGLRLGDEDMVAIALKVGADVPFFIMGGGKCLVEGIGERVTPLEPDEDLLYLVFRPHKRLSTRQAYKRWDDLMGSFEEMARLACPGLSTIFSLFPTAVVSGKGPSTFVKIPLEDHGRAVTLTGLLAVQEPWDGDIFLAAPCPGISMTR